MMRIAYNGESCANCGFDVAELVVNFTYTRDGEQFRANCTMPCGCIHGVTSVGDSPSSLLDDLVRYR